MIKITVKNLAKYLNKSPESLYNMLSRRGIQVKTRYLTEFLDFLIEYKIKQDKKSNKNKSS